MWKKNVDHEKKTQATPAPTPSSETKEAHQPTLRTQETIAARPGFRDYIHSSGRKAVAFDLPEDDTLAVVSSTQSALVRSSPAYNRTVTSLQALTAAVPFGDAQLFKNVLSQAGAAHPPRAQPVPVEEPSAPAHMTACTSRGS